MTSWQARGVSLFLRLARKRRYRTEAHGLRVLSRGRPAAPPPTALHDRITSMPGVPVRVLSPLGGAPVGRGRLIYWHGGAFVNGIAKQHWQLIEHLADATGREVLVPTYGLAPEHHVDEALALLDEVLDALPVDLPVHLLGDSAGGNLALLQALRHPSRVVGLTLIAPWLDLSMSNPAVDLVEPRDPWLCRAGLRPVARAWVGGRELRDPAVSPLFGDLTRLPPTLVQVGDRDISLPDCRVLAARSGPAAHLTVAAGLPHNYPLLPIPEARPARAEIVGHVEATFAGVPDLVEEP